MSIKTFILTVVSCIVLGCDARENKSVDVEKEPLDPSASDIARYKTGAEAGDAIYQYLYARSLTHISQSDWNAGKRSVPEGDKKKAFELAKKSADQGYSYGQNYLGFCHYFGIGTPSNAVEAVKWYTLAAEQDCPKALMNLGECYSKGDGVRKDQTAAFNFFLAASKNGYALFNLAIAYCDGSGCRRNLDKAEAYFRKAIDKGDKRAIWGLAYFYCRVRQDDGQALYWFDRMKKEKIQISTLQFRTAIRNHNPNAKADLNPKKIDYDAIIQKEDDEFSSGCSYHSSSSYSGSSSSSTMKYTKNGQRWVRKTIVNRDGTKSVTDEPLATSEKRLEGVLSTSSSDNIRVCTGKTLVIAATSDGDITVERGGTLIVAGSASGNIHIDEGGCLTVAGSLSGNVKNFGTTVVKGSMSGNIKSFGSLEVYGSMSGNIKYSGKYYVDPNAMVTGNVKKLD